MLFYVKKTTAQKNSLYQYVYCRDRENKQYNVGNGTLSWVMYIFNSLIYLKKIYGRIFALYLLRNHAVSCYF
jgi:hypothetical protein